MKAMKNQLLARLIGKSFIGAFFMGFAVHASALTINTFTNLANFQAAAGSLLIEDFSGEADGAFLTRDFGDFQIDLLNQNLASPQILSEELVMQTFDFNSIVQLTFDEAISAFGFDWRNTDSTNDAMELIVDGQIFNFGPAQQSGFYGVIATDGTFSTAGFSDTAGGGAVLSSGFIDDIRYSTIPTPTTLALFGLGLAGLGFVLRKKT